MNKTLKFRHQRSAEGTLECFDSWILLTMLASKDMASFVRQEAYERASLPDAETSSARDQSLILQFVIEHVLFFPEILYSITSYFGFVCQSVLPLASCLICLRVQASLYARLVLVVVVWFILER